MKGKTIKIKCVDCGKTREMEESSYKAKARWGSVPKRCVNCATNVARSGGFGAVQKY